MQHYMPQIVWHDRVGILSVDFHLSVCEKDVEDEDPGKQKLKGNREAQLEISLKENCVWLFSIALTFGKWTLSGGSYDEAATAENEN
ncbi:hypothetical protein Ddc_10359 [Ditylenchus destructor]|nr:hypothetical protein Ddc_10359 [Ditylenchus destructor]